MARYENILKCAQIRKLVDEKRFRKAAQIIEGMDIETVKSVTDLNAIAEVYIKTEQFDKAKIIYEKIYARARSRRVLYRLIYLSIRGGELMKAERYYEEFVQMDPEGSDRLVLRYRIDKAKGVSRPDLIKTLEQLKREDYSEEWAYELAKQYHREGMVEECVKECSDIILWFGEGEIVERALRLKEFHTGKSEDGSRRYFDTPENIEEMLKTQPIPILNTQNISAPVPPVNERPASSVKESSEVDARILEAKTIDFVSDIEDLLPPEMPSEPIVLPEEPPVEEPFPNIRLTPEQEAELMHHSQSGTGITLDLAKEISAIVEAEQNQQFQLSEKVTKIETMDTSAYPITESLRLTPEEEQKLAALEEREPVSSVPLDNVADRMGQALDRMMAKRMPDDTRNDTSLEEIVAPVEPSVPKMISPAPELNPLVQEMVSPAPAIQTMTPEATFPADTAQTVAPDMAFPADAAQTAAPDMTFSADTAQTVAPDMTFTADAAQTASPDMTFSADAAQTVAPEATSSADVPQAAASGESFPPITTMALRLSFQDILTMIGADPEPTHFVLIARDAATTLGVTKQIIKTVNGKGYINASQIARITAEKLNLMDLDKAAGKLRGGCLLVEKASELTIPTVSSLIKMMDEFGPEVVVILADDGPTLEDLFDRALALNRRFKYVIDITGYNMEDYQ